MANEETQQPVASGRDTGRDNDAGKGGMEPDSRKQEGNNSMAGQLAHRDEASLAAGSDSDFPEPGESPEHSGELPELNRAVAPAGERSKPKPGDPKDDSAAA